MTIVILGTPSPNISIFCEKIMKSFRVDKIMPICVNESGKRCLVAKLTSCSANLSTFYLDWNISDTVRQLRHDGKAAVLLINMC